MCPTKEQRIPACNTINHASIFKFFKWETVFPSKKIEVIEPEVHQQTEVLNNVSNFSSASPKARKFARELGVDINKVLGSERDGRVVEDDIKKFVALRSSNNTEVVEEKKPNKIKNEFEHSDFGEIEIKDIPRVKKLSSKYLINSCKDLIMVIKERKLRRIK